MRCGFGQRFTFISMSSLKMDVRQIQLMSRLLGLLVRRTFRQPSCRMYRLSWLSRVNVREILTFDFNFDFLCLFILEMVNKCHKNIVIHH